MFLQSGKGEGSLKENGEQVHRRPSSLCAAGTPPAYWTAVTKNVKALIASGHCPLQIFIDYAAWDERVS